MRNLRETAKETQGELAELLSVSKQSVSNWENGNIRPTLDVVCQLADHYGCSTDYLLGLSDRDFFIDSTFLTDLQQHHLFRLAREFERLNRETDKIHLLPDKRGTRPQECTTVIQGRRNPVCG